MAKFLARSTSGTTDLEEVTPIITSAGAADAYKVLQTGPDGRVHISALPDGIGDDAVTSTADGALSAGDWVYITEAGEIARASASAGSPHRALGHVEEASADGAPATIVFGGRNDHVTGLTPGRTYYLSDTVPGGETDTPVTGAGKLHQSLGVAITTTAIAVDIGESIGLA